MKHPTTFKVYASIRAARQSLGDRIDDLTMENYDNPVIKQLDKVWDLLQRAETEMEGISDSND